MKLVIPEYDPNDPEPYPCCIRPGTYDLAWVVDMLRLHSGQPAVVWFIADMLEE